MRHPFLSIVILAAVSAVTLAEWGLADEPLVVATFNIRYDNPRDGADAWPHRRDRVAEMVTTHGMQIVGMQEALRRQIADLTERLPDYDWYGVGRDDGRESGEFAPIFYRRDRFELLDGETFWLSETPDVPGSRSWDAAITRIATRCRFRDLTDGRVFVVYNTHFDHRGAEARLRSAQLLRKRTDSESLPVLVLGDFNCLPESEPYNALVAPAGLRDARTISGTDPLGPDSSWSGFREVQPGRRIDFVFVGPGWDVAAFEIRDDTFDERFPSDHLPVLTTVRATP